MHIAARLVSTTILLKFSALLSSPLACAEPGFLIAAAADLQPLQAQLQTEFAKVAGVRPEFTFAASGSLAQQIQNGAPYDVYLSANERFVNQLRDSGRILPDTVAVYAYGRIALWSKGNRFKSLPELAAAAVRHVAIANPTHAPYGAAAQSALRNQGLWDKLKPKLVYGENVEQAYRYAETGNADAAIVGWSLVFNQGGILLPAVWHPKIAQTGAVVKGCRHPELGRKFLAFLTSREGKAVLRGFGFDLPD
jgi:molybdate transport system substrate-binding protein